MWSWILKKKRYFKETNDPTWRQNTDASGGIYLYLSLHCRMLMDGIYDDDNDLMVDPLTEILYNFLA